VYLSYIEILTKIDWGKFTVEGDQGIRLAVPMIVIDELDATKSDHLRGRASLALAVLDKALRTDGKLAEDPVLVEVRLFSDPMGHRRLPINDQEIIRRTLALQAITQSPVTLLTCDTGMALRAREASLTVKKGCGGGEGRIRRAQREPVQAAVIINTAAQSPINAAACAATPKTCSGLAQICSVRISWRRLPRRRGWMGLRR
jgi:hypothetical protein